MYCGRKCSGLGRRTNKTKAQKVADKAAYDKEYRAKNLGIIKAKKAAHFQKTYDPKAAAVERKKRAHLHAAYCKTPKYLEYKKRYDLKRYAETFGPAADLYLLLRDLDSEIDGRMSDYEIRLKNGTLNKRTQRKREYDKVNNGNL